MRKLYLAILTAGMVSGFGGAAGALEVHLPHMQNPNMAFMGPFEGNLYTRTDVLPQARPWFPTQSPSYGPYADPWFEAQSRPVGRVFVRPTGRITK